MPSRESPPQTPMSTTHTSSPSSTSPGLQVSLPETFFRHNAPTPPNFVPEEQTYLCSRLPLQEPATHQTITRHFERLPFLYRELAEAYRSRAAGLREGDAELQRRERMADLAGELAKRYQTFRLVLPPSYARDIMAKWRRSETRASRFWERVLDEVEKANRSWSIVRMWIILFVIQSTLVAVAYSTLPDAARLALLVANALAYVWSTTVMCEMLHASYMVVKSDEQELHDLMGGLR